MLASQLKIVEHDQHGTLLAVPTPDDADQVAHGTRVDGIKRLVEQDQPGVLQQHTCEERPLQLASRERIDAARLKAGKSHRCERHVDRLAVVPRDAPEHAAAAPEPERNEVAHAGRECAIDLRDLRQIGDPVHREARSDDVAAERLHNSDNALEQRRFSCPVRADDRDQRSHLHVAAQVMHHRVAVITERQVLEGDQRAHGGWPVQTPARQAAHWP